MISGISKYFYHLYFSFIEIYNYDNVLMPIILFEYTYKFYNKTILDKSSNLIF